MHVFTKQGDGGRTKLYDNTPVDKDHAVIVANGHIDELTSHIGVVKAMNKDTGLGEQLEQIQQELVQLMGYMAGLKQQDVNPWVERLEAWIMAYEKCYPKQQAFVLPGRSHVSAELDITRTVCRRAERSMVDLSHQQPIEKGLLGYINRLSDYFHVVARYMEFVQMIEDEVRKNMPEVVGSKETKSNRLTLDKANVIIEAVKAKAEAMGLKAVVAVAGSGGHPIAVQAMDDAYIASYDIALNKAYTAVSVKMTTEELGRLAGVGGPLYGIQQTNGGRMVIFGGGIPLKKGKDILGGIGVSGGSAEQDIALANCGLEAFNRLF